MNLLVVTDLDGNELFLNPDHIAYVRFPGAKPTNTKAIVHMTTGNDIPVRDTPGQVCYKILAL